MKFLLANFLIFFSLAAAIFYQISTAEEVKVAKVLNSERTPASINPKITQETSLNTKVVNTEALKEISKNLDCTVSDKQVLTREELVIVSGINCGKFKNIKITNTSNGFTASVFELSEKQYKTDLIPLTIGANKIFVEYQLNTKKQQTIEKKTEFIIYRQ